MERPRRGCVNLPYLAGTKKRPVNKGTVMGNFPTANGGFWPTSTFSMSNLKVKNIENGFTFALGT